jgi:hypothetical protein
MDHWDWQLRWYNPYGISKRKECMVTILWDDTLMAEDGMFMDKAVIDKECSTECSKHDTCKQLVDLLKHWKYKEAQDLLFQE